MVGNPVRYDLASSVRDALAFHARTSRERIVTFNNANKYSASDGVNHDDEALPEIGADAGTGDRFGFLFRPLTSAPA